MQPARQRPNNISGVQFDSNSQTTIQKLDAKALNHSGSSPPHPKAATAPPRRNRKSGLELFHIMMREITVAHKHLELTVKGQDRRQEILLAQKTKFIEPPVPPIIEWQENVVNVHNHTWVKPGNHFEEKIIDVAANLHGVRDRKSVV